MIISDEDSRLFFNMLLKISVLTALKAEEYLLTHKPYSFNSKYPVLRVLFDRSNPEYSELFESVPYLKYQIPRYFLQQYPDDKVDYSTIFIDFFNEDAIDCSQIEGFEDIIDFAKRNELLKNLFAERNESDSLHSSVKSMIHSIVARYMYNTDNRELNAEYIQQNIITYVLEKVFRYTSDHLDIDIYVPLCLVSFEDKKIELSDSVEIIAIPDAIQRARQQACEYEATGEDWVAACATHMLVIHDYHFNNIDSASLVRATSTHTSYPFEIIDRITAAIRIATGYSAGYAQILAKPLGWVDSFSADIDPLYGAKTHSFNPQEAKKFWMHLNIDYVTALQAQKIKEIYSIFDTKRDNQEFHKVFFALRRLNRCMLREETDDTAIDAIIGIEILLSGGTQGEITYTISNRIPVVFSKLDDTKYSAQDSRKFMKQIYSYRSAIVHGRKTKEKDEYITFGDKQVHVKDVAIDFLRYSLLFILDNISYLDVNSFESEIDSALNQKQE